MPPAAARARTSKKQFEGVIIPCESRKSKSDDHRRPPSRRRNVLSQSTSADTSGESKASDDASDTSYDLDEDEDEDQTTTKPRMNRPSVRTTVPSTQKKGKKKLPCKNYAPEKLRKMVNDRNDEIAKLRERLDRKANVIKRTKHLKGFHLTHKKANVDKLKQDKQKKARLTEVVEEVSRERDDHKQAFDGMRGERLGLLRRSDVPASGDEEVKGTLILLLQDSRAWAYAWAVTSWADVDAVDVEPILRNLMDTGMEAFAMDRASAAVTNGKITTRILLRSLMNRELFWSTFVRPLSVLEAEINSATSVRMGKSITETMTLLQTRAPAAAQRMRALILLAHTIQPRTEQDDPTAYNLSPLDPQIESHVDHVMHRINLVCKPLLKVDTKVGSAQSRDSQLKLMVRRFVEASIRINAQNPTTVTAFRSELSEHRFTLPNEYLEAASAMKLIDNDDGYQLAARQAGLEGRELDLVVEPAVIRKGDKDGLDYSDERLLVKAVVWMVRDEDLNSKSQFAPAAKKDTASKATEKRAQPPASNASVVSTNSPSSATEALTEMYPSSPEERKPPSGGMQTRRRTSMQAKRRSDDVEAPNKEQRTEARDTGGEKPATCQASSPGHTSPQANTIEHTEQTKEVDKAPETKREEARKQSPIVEVEDNYATTPVDTSPASPDVTSSSQDNEHGAARSV